MLKNIGDALICANLKDECRATQLYDLCKFTAEFAVKTRQTSKLHSASDHSTSPCYQAAMCTDVLL